MQTRKHDWVTNKSSGKVGQVHSVSEDGTHVTVFWNDGTTTNARTNEVYSTLDQIAVRNGNLS